MAAKGIGDSLNPYAESLFFISARTPEELEQKIKAITQPFTIKAIYGINSRHIAWLIGDVRTKRKRKG